MAANCAKGLLEIVIHNKLEVAFGLIENYSKHEEMREKAHEKLSFVFKKKLSLHFSTLRGSMHLKMQVATEHICKGSLNLSHMFLRKKQRNMNVFMIHLRAYNYQKAEMESPQQQAKSVRMLVKSNSLLLTQSGNYLTAYKVLNYLKNRNMSNAFR